MSDSVETPSLQMSFKVAPVETQVRIELTALFTPDIAEQLMLVLVIARDQGLAANTDLKPEHQEGIRSFWDSLHSSISDAAEKAKRAHLKAVPEPPQKRAAVSLVVRQDGRMLCVWNKRYAGWTMPGGLVEEGETTSEACARELREETGLHFFTYEQVYDGPVESLLRDGRGTHVYVFRVEPRGYDAFGEEERPREIEVGCPVTWLTREEFLAWSPFSAFYEKMFKELEAGK